MAEQVDLSKINSGEPQQMADRESPLVISWEAFKKSESYENSKKWAAYPEHLEGSLWALFSTGFMAAAQFERARCVDVVNAARNGEIDTDLRSIRACIEDGYIRKDSSNG
jgi:hypothetical protein